MDELVVSSAFWWRGKTPFKSYLYDLRNLWRRPRLSFCNSRSAVNQATMLPWGPPRRQGPGKSETRTITGGPQRRRRSSVRRSNSWTVSVIPTFRLGEARWEHSALSLGTRTETKAREENDQDRSDLSMGTATKTGNREEQDADVGQSGYNVLPLGN